MMMEYNDIFVSDEIVFVDSTKKRKHDSNENTDEFFSDVLSPDEIDFFTCEGIADSVNQNFIHDVLRISQSDPSALFESIPQNLFKEEKKIKVEQISASAPQPIKAMVTIPSKQNNGGLKNLQSTFTLDISPKTRVSNNPKDISITVNIKIPDQQIRSEIPDKILLWSSARKLTERVTAVNEEGIEVQVDPSSCFVVLINFDLRDKDDIFVSHCNEHLAKEKQGCQFHNAPGPALFRHVGSLNIKKKEIKCKNSSFEAFILSKTFQNIRVDKKGHFCKSSKYKLNLNSQVDFPLSLQREGVSCAQSHTVNVNYSKQTITDFYWVEKLMTACHSAQLKFSSQRVFSIAVNSPQLTEEMSKTITSFQHLGELDMRYVNPFLSSNYVQHVLSNIYEKCIYIKEITLHGSISDWKSHPDNWSIIEKLCERFWDLKVHFSFGGSISTHEN